MNLEERREELRSIRWHLRGAMILSVATIVWSTAVIILTIFMRQGD